MTTPGEVSERSSTEFDVLHEFLKEIEKTTHWLADGPSFHGVKNKPGDGTREFLRFIRERVQDDKGVLKVLKYDAVLALRILCNAIEMRRDDVVKIILMANSQHDNIPWMLHGEIIVRVQQLVNHANVDDLSPVTLVARLGDERIAKLLILPRGSNPQ